jgi:cytochrome P450
MTRMLAPAARCLSTTRTPVLREARVSRRSFVGNSNVHLENLKCARPQLLAFTHTRSHSSETTTTNAPATKAASEQGEPNNASLSGPSPPGPSSLDGIRAVFSGALRESSYKIQLRQEYGDVVQLWAFQPLVFIFDPDIYMQILRQEWSLPFGAAPGTWPLVKYYQNRSPDCMPMMLLQGEAWKAPRQTLQTHMFSPKAADSYQPGISSVVDDAAEYLRKNPYPRDLNEFLCNASFEMLAQVLLERRMGLLDDSSGQLERQFVSSAVDAFHALGELLMMPPLTNNTLLRCIPTWNKLESNMDKVWDIGMQWLEETEESLPEAALVTKLSNQGKMDRQERLVNLVTILQAGVDTTSNSLAWALYELAKRPAEQERLRQELRHVLPPGEGFKRELLSELPYLKAFLREVQRVSPTAAGTMRRLPFDVEAGDYVVEKGSILFWEAAPYNFDPELLGGDPDEFRPERWLAADRVPKDADPRVPVRVDGFDVMAPAPILSHPLVATPFSVGPRMCVGARVAQNEMHTFVSRICRDFKLTLDPPDQDVKAVSKLVFTPDPSPRIRFEPV